MWSAMLTKMELEVLSAHAPHGTHARYNAHLLKDQEPCDRCRDGEARYRAELRAKRHADPEHIERSRRGAVFAPRTRTIRVQDEELEDDEPEDERPWADDLEDAELEQGDREDEELEAEDEAPSWLAVGATIAAGLVSARIGGPVVPPPEPVTARGHTAGPPRRPAPSPAGPQEAPPHGAPNDRLKAITKSIAAHPRDPRCPELLVEAVPHLRGGIVALR